ncbi:hypothetical protein HX005_06800 [Acinetobacter sp. R933-2]|uniref:hypothetical protein n=1 Tax=Acinetobacter sp. R933-2 TaxID=2746728 RepID=UPI002576E8C1|nr:hypothetical protein [Acinetobacter sp. R933-2]MDM1247090.1 hypothetical protein [Acinetobacter sp. R933-2]
MKICISTPTKEAFDQAQLACFKHGWDWESAGSDYIEFGSNEWKTEPEFVLNDDCWHETVSHLCVIDKTLCISYVEDGDPVEDGFELKTIEELKLIK